MRYGLLADIHGNLEALESVMRDAKDAQIDKYVFLGDAVGYGACPNEVCAWMREIADVAVVGNHDVSVCGRGCDDDFCAADTRRALSWSERQLTEQNREWLSKLPFFVRDGDLSFCHGSPFEPERFEYIFSVDDLEDKDLGTLPWVSFMGHSHVAIAFVTTSGTTSGTASGGSMVCQGPQFELDHGNQYIITVGSVGQPRDRDSRACYGILDTDTRFFEYRRVEYDIRAARQRIIDAHLPGRFGDRLLVGF